MIRTLPIFGTLIGFILLSTSAWAEADAPKPDATAKAEEKPAAAASPPAEIATFKGFTYVPNMPLFPARIVLLSTAMCFPCYKNNISKPAR
jgi:hypothetical protein